MKKRAPIDRANAAPSTSDTCLSATWSALFPACALQFNATSRIAASEDGPTTTKALAFAAARFSSSKLLRRNSRLSALVTSYTRMRVSMSGRCSLTAERNPARSYQSKNCAETGQRESARLAQKGAPCMRIACV